MVAQDIPFIYHLEFEGVARERGWYMNGISWANIAYLFNILTVIGQSNQQSRLLTFSYLKLEELE